MNAPWPFMNRGCSMPRNFGLTGRETVGENQSPGPHHRANTRRNRNLLADHSPPGRLHLAVVRDSSFLRKRELDPVEELDAINNRCQLAAVVMLSVFGVSFGVLLAIAVALLDWS